MRKAPALLERLNRLLLHRHAFWLLFVPVVVLFLGIAATVALGREQMAVRTVLALQSLTARSSAELLQAHLLRQLQLLSGMADDVALQALLLRPGPPEAQVLAPEFTRVLQRSAEVDQVQWWTPQASVSVAREGSQATPSPPLPEGLGADVLQLPPGKALLSHFVLRQDPAGRLVHPLEPQLYLAAPVRNAQGLVRGALVLRLNLQALLALQASEDRFGSSMQWVDAQGRWLYVNHPEEQAATASDPPGRFVQRHAALWSRMGTQPLGQHKDADGLWAWHTAQLGQADLRTNTLALAQGPSVVLVNKVHPQTVTALRLLHVFSLVPVVLAVALLLLGLIWRWLLHHARASILAQKQLEISNRLALIEGWELDPGTRQLYAGPSLQAQLGWTQSPAGWAQFLDLLPQAGQREALDQAVRYALLHGGSFDQEIAVQTSGQALRWLRWVGLCEPGAGGRRRRCYGTAQDITPRKRLEQVRAEERRRLSSIIEGTQVGTWEANLQSGTTEINDHWARMLGYTVAELAPMTIARWVAMLHPEDRDRVQEAVRQHLQAPHEQPYATRFRLQHRDGHWVWVAARGQLVEYGADGEPTRMLGTHTDVTDLVEARQRAEVASQAKTVFLSTISHELRTPLNGILGFGQVLEHDPELNADQLESVAEILKAGRHLLALIEEILDLSKVEAGQLDLSAEAVPLAPLAQDSLNLVQGMAAPLGVSLAHTVPAGLSVLADPVRLRQVLLNLLSNAIKYNRPGGKVLLGAQGLEGMVRITVQDSGLGIPPEHLPQLFQPFQRGPAAHSQVEGTGIGLAIAKGLVEKMRGQIGVLSLPGEGATFWFTLPLAARPEGAPDDAPPPLDGGPWENGPGRPPPPWRRKGRVLCIDDNHANLELLTRLLRSQPGLQVVASNDPFAAVDLALHHRPDLVLLDIQMPGMDGHAVLRALRAQPALAAIPVVAVTADALPSDRARALAAGFAAYVTKPFTMADLLSVLEAHLPQPPAPG